MSNINGASGNHYISNVEILAWMQEKTDGIYTKMGNAMDVSNDRADAEDALNNIKSKIADAQAGKADGNEVYTLVNQTIDKYGDEFPELKETLGEIAKELKDQGARVIDPNAPKPTIPPPPPQTQMGSDGVESSRDYIEWQAQYGEAAAAHPELVVGAMPAPTIDEPTSNRWQESIKNRVDSYTKDDQLGLINIQEYNAQLNQAKQTASALMDASDKAANSIISHIG